MFTLPSSITNPLSTLSSISTMKTKVLNFLTTVVTLATSPRAIAAYLLIIRALVFLMAVVIQALVVTFTVVSAILLAIGSQLTDTVDVSEVDAVEVRVSSLDAEVLDSQDILGIMEAAPDETTSLEVPPLTVSEWSFALGNMTIPQIRELAQNNAIWVPKRIKKADLIDRVSQVLGSPEQPTDL